MSNSAWNTFFLTASWEADVFTTPGGVDYFVTFPTGTTKIEIFATCLPGQDFADTARIPFGPTLVAAQDPLNGFVLVAFDTEDAHTTHDHPILRYDFDSRGPVFVGGTNPRAAPVATQNPVINVLCSVEAAGPPTTGITVLALP